jgi:thiol-disulfide isomerase/thioredoxin
MCRILSQPIGNPAIFSLFIPRQASEELFEMKKILLVYLLLFLVSIASGQKTGRTFFFPNNVFRVEGKIKGYQPNDKNGFVTLRTYSIDGSHKDNIVKIEPNGSFQADLSQPFEGDVELGYSGDFITIYAGHREKILLEIDEGKWRSEANKTKTINFSGKSSAVSKRIADFQFERQNYPFKNKPDWGEKTKSDEIFSKTSIARMQEELALFDGYVAKNKITDIQFKKWGRNSIIYETGVNIAFFCFAGKRNKTITFEKLISYLKLIPVNNPAALTNSYYYKFLHILSQDFQIITNINSQYADAIRDVGNNKLLFGLNEIDKYATGIAKQLMYYFLFRNFKDREEFKLASDRFKATVKIPFLKTLSEKSTNNPEEAFDSFNVIEKIKNYPEGQVLASRLSALLETKKDSYAFIYFWGSWCSPCLRSMPLFPKLIEELNGKPVIFVFFAVDTEAKAVEEIKNKYQIKAEFISLTENEIAIFNKVLQFSSLPRYFIFDPTGKLANKLFIKLASEKDIQPMVREIDKTLKQKIER